MNFDLGPEISKVAPGIFGSLVASLFMKQTTWLRTIAMFIAGALLARYGTPAVSKWLSLDDGFTGFLMGLFGMAIVSGVFEWLQSNSLGATFNEWVRQVLRLPPKREG